MKYFSILLQDVLLHSIDLCSFDEYGVAAPCQERTGRNHRLGEIVETGPITDAINGPVLTACGLVCVRPFVSKACRCGCCHHSAAAKNMEQKIKDKEAVQKGIEQWNFFAYNLCPNSEVFPCKEQQLLQL